MSLLFKILMGVFVVVLLIIFSAVWVGFWRTSKIQSDSRQGIFLGGTLPSPNPDGFYAGTATRHKTSWLGKKFNAAESTGVNVFDDGKGGRVEKYPFKTYVGKGLQDKNLDVLKIDYNIEGNPFWLRFVLDEIVKVKSNYYLGKMHIRIIPGFPFSVLYFDLKK